MGFGDTFDPAGMLVYNNQIENMRLRNRLYEMQYSKQEQAEHKQAQDEAETLGALNRRLREQQSAMTPSAVGGGTPSGGQTPVGANPMSTEGPTRMAAISQRLKGVGMTDDQIAGSLGGLSMETAGFDPNTVNPKSGAFGIGQWLGDRLQNLKQYAAYNNKPINDFGTQLDFLESELRWGQKGSLQAILNAKTRPDVVNAWTDKFEVSDATPALREKGVKFANNMNVGNMTADTSGKTVPPSPTGMAYQGQQQQQQPKQYGSIAEARGDLFAQEYLEKQQAAVQQQQQQFLNNSAPILTELMAQYSKNGDNKGKDAALDGISGLYAGKPNADLVNQRLAELRKVDVSGPAGTFAFEGEVTPATLSLAKDLRVPPQIMAGLQGRLGQYLNMKVENSQVKEWKTERKGGDEEKNKTKEQLFDIAQHDPDPEKRKRAQENLAAMKEYDLAVAGAKTEQSQTAAEAEGARIVEKYHLDDELLEGKRSPSMIAQSFRQPYVQLIAVANAIKKDPSYNAIEADKNAQWYGSAQRLIRRTESIVAPDGAADEAIRFAKLVDNPAVTPLNKLTGKAKVMFGNSQRSLLNLVQGLSSEEVSQIMGAQGGGERFNEFTQSLNDTNQSVKQYVNNVKELKWLVYTRQKANVYGTPAQKRWDAMEKNFKDDRPFAGKADNGGDKSKDDFIKKAKAAGSKMSDEDLGKYYDQEHGGK